jgi:hypothetical protein
VQRHIKGGADRAADHCKWQHHGVYVFETHTQCEWVWVWVWVCMYACICFTWSIVNPGALPAVHTTWSEIHGRRGGHLKSRCAAYTPPSMAQKTVRVPADSVPHVSHIISKFRSLFVSLTHPVPGTYLCQSCIDDQPQSTDWKVWMTWKQRKGG